MIEGMGDPTTDAWNALTPADRALIQTNADVDHFNNAAAAGKAQQWLTAKRAILAPTPVVPKWFWIAAAAVLALVIIKKR